MQTFRMTIRDVLADNFKKLRDATPSLDRPQDIVRFGAATNGTIGRISKRQTGPTIDTLEILAAAYGLQVWQLLVPTLHAEKGTGSSPVISGMPEWPFERVDRDAYEALDYPSKIAVQVRLRDAIKEEAELERTIKANGTNK